MGQQTSLFDRFLEQPLVLAVAGTMLGMYLIGTFEERRAKREKKDDDEVPEFVSPKDKELWEKFRSFYRQEIGNPDKAADERIDLLHQNIDKLQKNVEELLDRTHPSWEDEELDNAEKQSKA